MQKDGYEPVLKNSRWCLLKRGENLTEKQEVKLKDLLQYNLRSVRAYLIKEDFNGFGNTSRLLGLRNFLITGAFESCARRLTR